MISGWKTLRKKSLQKNVLKILLRFLDKKLRMKDRIEIFVVTKIRLKKFRIKNRVNIFVYKISEIFKKGIKIFTLILRVAFA